jgi:hypothetical protein
MSVWTGVVLVYLVVRSAVAIVLLWRGLLRHDGAALAAQALSDAAAAVFLAGYASYAFRTALGLFAVPLFIGFVVWEAIAAARRFAEMGESVGETWSDAELIGGTFRWAWDMCGIAPPFLAGAVLVFNGLIPGQVALPGAPGPFECTPAVVVRGDSITLSMAVPHGSELGVFTPQRVYFALVTAPAARSNPPVRRFETQEQIVVPTARGRSERIFADTGAYLFTLSQYHDLSVTNTCVVRMTTAAQR